MPDGLRHCCKKEFRFSVPMIPLCMGHITCISLEDSCGKFFGIFSKNSSLIKTKIFSGSSSWKRKKLSVCFFLSENRGCSPLLIRCALITIWLSCACLKISSSHTTSIILELMISCRTFPGPTEGSWLLSPININVLCRGTAFSRKYMR